MIWSDVPANESVTLNRIYRILNEGLDSQEIESLRERHALLEEQVAYIVSMQDDKTMNPGDELIAKREEIKALRQRHAEAVRACWDEAFRTGLLNAPDPRHPSNGACATSDTAWLASKAKARLT